MSQQYDEEIAKLNQLLSDEHTAPEGEIDQAKHSASYGLYWWFMEDRGNVGYYVGWHAAREKLLPLLRAALPLMDADLEFKADDEELGLIARIEEAVKE